MNSKEPQLFQDPLVTICFIFFIIGASIAIIGAYYNSAKWVKQQRYSNDIEIDYKIKKQKILKRKIIFFLVWVFAITWASLCSLHIKLYDIF